MSSTPPKPHFEPPALRPINQNTVHFRGLQLPDLEQVQAGLELAWRTIQAAPKPGAPGVHVFAVHRRDIVVRFLPASPDEHLVLGRHAECDIQLSADPTISLRHVLAKSIRLEDGAAALRLLDLATPRPFTLADGSVQTSVVATGPFAVALGEYVVGGIPHDVEEYQTQGGPYRTRALVESAQRIPLRALQTPAGRRSRITLMPGSRLLTQIPAWSGEGFARVTLARGGNVSSIVLDEAMMEQGILIGRAERCLDRGLRAMLTTSISRVHLLLLRDGAHDVAIDLCSTQGTYAAGARLRMVRLPSAFCRLTLGHVDPVDMAWDRVRLG